MIMETPRIKSKIGKKKSKRSKMGQISRIIIMMSSWPMMISGLAFRIVILQDSSNFSVTLMKIFDQCSHR